MLGFSMLEGFVGRVGCANNGFGFRSVVFKLDVFERRGCFQS